MSFLSHAIKTYIHTNGFAPGLGLKRRLSSTRKWAINLPIHNRCRQSNEPINSNQIHEASAKRGETRISKLRLA